MQGTCKITFEAENGDKIEINATAEGGGLELNLAFDPPINAHEESRIYSMLALVLINAVAEL